MAEFAYLTGWRVQSEVLPLEWRNVDLKSGTVSLDVGSTKNGEGRTIYLTAALRTLLEAQKAGAEDGDERPQDAIGLRPLRHRQPDRPASRGREAGSDRDRDNRRDNRGFGERHANNAGRK